MTRHFLVQIADRYVSPAEKHHLEDYVFVFPNKRSARFLKHYMQQRVRGTSFMPRFTTLGALMSRFSDFPEVRHNEALFELYDAYREALAAAGNDNPRDFDKFIFWGEMMLSDFEEIDRSAASAEKIYTNLSRLKEISADYLEEEQKEVVREIWGEQAVPESIDSFWRHVGRDDKEMSGHFVSLWDLLGDIYRRFRDKLLNKGLCTAAMQQKRALEALRSNGPALVVGLHYVFVGFGSLSVVETLIFDRFKDLGVATFYWDDASPYIKCGGINAAREAEFGILDKLIARFPMPPGTKLDAVECVPRIDVIGIPSRSAQAKVMCEVLTEWIKNGQLNPANAINTAVIVPDENLLMSILHTLPPEIKAVNITMGLPFATTSFAALLRAAVALQMRARLIRGEWRMYHEDILEIVNHPHIRTAARAESVAIRKLILEKNLYTLTTAELREVAPSLAFIFRGVEDINAVSGVRSYIEDLLDGLLRLLRDNAGTAPAWEAALIEYLRKEITELSELIHAHGVTAGERSYFTLFERAMRSCTIMMEGTPLCGLQVMGVQETRALDFDNIIFMSMNERVFPRRASAKTMLPNNIRAGYGLPPVDRAESDAAYVFYRLIARARNVALIYDSRDASSGSGEASRFISQLRYLYPAGNLHMMAVNMGANAPEKRVISIKKTGDIIKKLDAFRPGGRAFISASALKTFKHCPLKFYLQNVCGMRGEDSVTEYMTSAQYGTILHAAAQRIYEDYKGKPITAAVLAGLATDVKARYTSMVEQIIQREYYHREAAPGVELPVEGQIVRDLILDFLQSMFRHEMHAWCPAASDSFEFLEAEKRVDGPWQVTPELSINFKMYIDRVDRTARGLRFIDYKTGGDLTEASSIDNLFGDDSRYDAMLQILAYCEAYADMREELPIQPVLYRFRSMDCEGGILPLTIGGEEVADFHCVSPEFRPRLNELISDIFNPEKPFCQAPEGSHTCNYCVFAPMCGRLPESYEG